MSIIYRYSNVRQRTSLSPPPSVSARLRACDNPSTAGAGAECEDLTGNGGDWEAEPCTGEGQAPPGVCEPEYQPAWVPQIETNKVLGKHPWPYPGPFSHATLFQWS